MKIDKIYAMNSFLTYRSVLRTDIYFTDKYPIRRYHPFSIEQRKKVYDSTDTMVEIKNYIDKLFYDDSRQTALMLSGGIDSAILAALVPAGTKAYTFKTLSSDSVDDVVYAKKYAEKFNLNHEIIDVTWDDYNSSIDNLMLHKGAPIHSIEPQIYKAALKAKKDGYTTLLFGENADIVFGGFNGLLSSDWNSEDFYHRYCFVNPFDILKKPIALMKPILKYTDVNDRVDVHRFINDIFYYESNGSYENSCSLAEIEFATPFNRLIMGSELDLKRVRSGENKYILREIFSQLYPDAENRKKIPMPRAVDTWFKDWAGPKHYEFIDSVDMSKFNGDQKWMIYVLERFLNLIGS
ncbi:asparagine synthase-related protein [Enterococcus casseliflavus]|uniref:asparagine synthase-related protein n=1 Tax=Enterococcus casseliflavus TaxID=37734 RepID=UPI001BCEFE14|nr:asparagine synthase-related protein [Enterococcus casseliflavus]